MQKREGWHTKHWRDVKRNNFFAFLWHFESNFNFNCHCSRFLGWWGWRHSSFSLLSCLFLNKNSAEIRSNIDQKMCREIKRFLSDFVELNSFSAVERWLESSKVKNGNSENSWKQREREKWSEMFDSKKTRPEWKQCSNYSPSTSSKRWLPLKHIPAFSAAQRVFFCA